MEIGISSQQLLDIGLNIAGFLTAGALLMVLRSLFTGSISRPTPAISRNVVSQKDQTEKLDEASPEESNSSVEFISLKGINWNSHQNSIVSKSIDNPDSPNRRKVIKLAQNMLTNARKLKQQSMTANTRPAPEGKTEVIRKGTGR